MDIKTHNLAKRAKMIEQAFHACCQTTDEIIDSQKSYGGPLDKFLFDTKYNLAKVYVMVFDELKTHNEKQKRHEERIDPEIN